MTMCKITRVSFLFLGMTMALATGPALAAASVGTVLENNAVSCFYLLMHAYRQELNVCKMPLDQAREQRFSRMSNRLEDYIRKNARLDPEAIIANAKGAAEKAAQSFPEQSLDVSRRILGEESLAAVPFCESSTFMRLRQAMLDFTTEETEKALDAQLNTGMPAANGSCY